MRELRSVPYEEMGLVRLPMTGSQPHRDTCGQQGARCSDLSSLTYLVTLRVSMGSNVEGLDMVLC